MKSMIGAVLALIGIDDIKYFWKIRANVVNSNRRTTILEELFCKIIR